MSTWILQEYSSVSHCLASTNFLENPPKHNTPQTASYNIEIAFHIMCLFLPNYSIRNAMVLKVNLLKYPVITPLLTLSLALSLALSLKTALFTIAK